MSADDVAAEAPAAAEPQQAAATPAAPSLPAERVKRPVRPDDTEIKATIDVLQQSINKNKRRIEEIKETIDAKRSGKSKGSGEQQAIKNKLAELRGQFQTLVSQKNQLRSQLDGASKARESARLSMKELRGSMKFTKVEDIDQYINDLEHRIQHDSLSLNEEKRILEQIKTLKKSRSTIGELTTKVSQLEADSSAVDGLRDGIKGIDGAIDKIKEQEEVLRQQLADMRAKEAEQGSDIPGLILVREECREVCKAAYQKIQDLRAELDAQWTVYKEQSAIFKVQLAEDRKVRQEEYLKQKTERDAERAARLADQSPEPFDKEVTLCDQLASYLKKFVAAEEAVEEKEEKDLSGALEGFKPMVKKEARKIQDDDAWLLGGGKKGKGKGKGKKEEKKVAAGPEKLTHSLDILDAFATLSLEVPLTTDKCGPLLEQVVAQKETYLQRRKEAKEKPETAAEPAAAAEQPQQDGAAGAAVEGAPAPKPKKGPKEAPPKLDDTASWPSIGGAPAAAAAEEVEAEEAEEEQFEEEQQPEEQPIEDQQVEEVEEEEQPEKEQQEEPQQLEEGEVAEQEAQQPFEEEAAADVPEEAAAEVQQAPAPATAANGDPVSAKLAVSEDGSVALTLSA